jgi:hypothetical protein
MTVKVRDNPRRSRGRPLITGRWSLVTLFLLGGCSGIPFQSNQTYYTDPHDLFRANYSTFEHAFTDAAAEDARRRAQAQCAQRKHVAVKTSSRCSLNLCTTSFQCMEPSEAAGYQTGGKP